MYRIQLFVVCIAMICAPTQAYRAVADSEALSSTRRPVNVLLIMSDQQNAHALGVYGNGFGGVTQSLSPEIDQLAAEGVRFTSAFCASPQCVPSRTSVLTGQWPHDHGVKWNGIFGPRFHETFPSFARKVGYETVSVGKDHLYWTDTEPIFKDYGFNYFIKKPDYFDYCFDNGEVPFAFAGNYSSMPNLPAGIVFAGHTFNANEFHREGYDADQTIEFLEARAADGAPFVAEYMPWGPHAPLLPSGPADPHDWAHLYHPFENLDLPPNHDKVPSTQLLAEIQATYSGLSEDEWKEILSYYYGLITQVDYNIGRVLDRLDELGLADDTLVIYTADHGEFGAEMSTWTKGKFHYDNINRIPLIIRFPGVLPAGRVIDSLVSNIDFFPTITELTGIPVPDARRAEVDGESLVALMLEDDEPAGWRQEVFSELGTDRFGKTRMVRTSTAKFTFDQETNEEELYDLAVDPWEIDNVVAEPAYASLRVDLKNRLDTWWGGEVGHAPDYTPNSSNAPPMAPERPNPPTTGTGVRRDIDPSWIPSPAASTQEIYLGTDPGSLQLFATLGHMDVDFNPGILDLFTTYYWRVDGGNLNGTTIGDLWSFTTRATGPGGPALPTGPSPADHAEDVGVTSQLSWLPAADGLTQVLYFGFADAMVQVATPDVAVTTFDPGQLVAGREYEWRVDQVNAAGTTESDVWRFTATETGLPAIASVLYPDHLVHHVAPAQLQLHWTSGAGATFHDVYLGTTFPLPYLGQTTADTFDPGALLSDTTYYWRVDEGNSLGTRLGSTWRFATSEGVGTNYCITNPNSTGASSIILATGNTIAAENDFWLHVAGAPPDKFGLFFYGLNQTQVPFGDGIRCIGGAVQRLRPTLQTDATGRGSREVNMAGAPVLSDISLVVPVSMNFQFWHRDNQGSTNLTDGLEVDFQ